MDKRSFLKTSMVTLAGGSIAAIPTVSAIAKESDSVLPRVHMNVEAITVVERQQRIAKAQKLMQEHGFSALILEPGAAMDYFSGIQWWRSERLTCVVIPKEGDIIAICPFFEEPSVRESLALKSDIRVWQEHESPFTLIAQFLKDKGLDQGKLGFENSVRYFVLEQTMALLPNARHTSAEPITLGCRMYKTANELRLLHKANEVTLAAYGYVFSQLKQGMTQQQVKSLMKSTQAKLGGSGAWCLALFNDASAYPHGTKQPQTIKEGSVVLMDSGCSVHGYQSDISRTFVFGKASKKQQQVWETVRDGQLIAFEKAKVGVSAGAVDDAVRAHYQTLGYGPEYQLPGLSHRTGHGIGMEGHESVNFVHGEQQLLAPGMCFSNEPGIYLPGQFGVRLEDCLYIGQERAHWFTKPPESLAQPLGTLNPLVV
ncbi:M24 family metallopeptidase [Thalassotalea ganghwensis]